MSFRRDADKLLAWKRWVNQHRDELTAAGVPAVVFSDERRWGHFLEEGGLDRETGWQVEMLSPQQAAALHHLVTREFQRPDLACFFRSLAGVVHRHEERPPSQG